MSAKIDREGEAARPEAEKQIRNMEEVVGGGRGRSFVQVGGPFAPVGCLYGGVVGGFGGFGPFGPYGGLGGYGF